MKTLTRTIIVLVALSMLATAFAQAQTNRPVAPSPAPSPPTPAPAPTPVQAVSQELDSLIGSLSFRSQAGSGNTVLVIPSEQTTTEDLLTINEDMNVMSRIFEKNLEQERVSTVTSNIFVSRSNVILPLLGSSRDQIQSMYLQGFGALFLLRVDFPLSPPPDVQEQEQEIQQSEQGDPVWDQMRQQMYEPEKVDRRRRTDSPESKYDPEKVENLKTTLIKALKHAANIRCLKPDESVILTIVGKGDITGTTIAGARAIPGEDQIVIVQKDAYGTKTQKVVQGDSLDVLEDMGLSLPTVLVIRTKKSDIDIFAKGDIDFEKFHQRVQLLTYPLLGGVDGGFRNPYGFHSHTRSTGSSSSR